MQTLPAVVPALHALVEMGESDVLIEARRAVPAMVEVVENFARQMTSRKKGHVQDLIEIVISVIAFATCARDRLPVPKETMDRMALVRESVLVAAGPNAPVCVDLDTLIARWNAKPP